MFSAIVNKIFGSVNSRLVNSLKKDIDIINSLEEKYAALSDAELKEQTAIFKKELETGKELDDILHSAFAVVREASKRHLDMRHFDEQLIGGIILHRGMIAEMKTGEGKTLVATLPAYLNALTGKGVHIVTVNDYLAKRDSDWMGKIYNALGLTVGCVVSQMPEEERKAAYNCDITHGTNNEFGFDYLRDNMKFNTDMLVQRPFNFAIVDEVDSIFIDEARTPLIISGPTEDNADAYEKIDVIVKQLKKEHYELDEKSKNIFLTEDGQNKVDELLVEAGLLAKEGNVYDVENISIVHHVNQALKANVIFRKDIDYMIKDDRIMIIDEFTGRVMEGRRYSDGLHQALEAKEKVQIQNENQTLASITYQNYFRLYPKLAGMTGTAMTEAGEFLDIYNLDVAEIPTHKQVIRVDEEDDIYRTAAEKYDAIIELIKDANARKQPVLVGTVSIEKSEYLSKILKKAKIKHNVLNAKYHEKEANIIAQAGVPCAVTIATNMAGRGTDIMLGGNPEMMLQEANVTEDKIEFHKSKISKQVEDDKEIVIKAGGLLVIGTERHESRRIDNQLRGRSGRQGDPGRTKFFISLEDDLMRIFGSERISGMLQKLGLRDGEAIQHPWISKAIEGAQKKVEERNYEIRKNLLKFDDVMNDQRKVIYEQRLDMLSSEDLLDVIDEMRLQILDELLADYIPKGSYKEQWNLDNFANELKEIFGNDFKIKEFADKDGIGEEEIFKKLDADTRKHYDNKLEKYGLELNQMAAKRILILTLDQLWKDHLYALDSLRGGIGLRAYGQKDPLSEYKREAFNLFNLLLEVLRKKVTQAFSLYEIDLNNVPTKALPDSAPQKKYVESHGKDANPMKGEPLMHRVDPENRDANNPESWGRVGRNEACPCGSGKKYKQCHGKF